MNKKRLSVVMAGAMLASSVAPVLAAEEVSVTEVQKGNLISDLTDKLWDGPVFSKDPRVENIDAADGNVSLAGKSVYGLKIGDATKVTVFTVDHDANVKSDLQKVIQGKIKDLAAGTKIELVNLGSREVTENGEKLILSTEETTTYTDEDLANTNGTVHSKINNLFNKTNGTLKDTDIVDDYKYVANKGYVITLTAAAETTYGEKEIILKSGSTRLNFESYLNKDKASTPLTNTAITDFKGFAKAAPIDTDIADKVEATYKIATDGTTLALSDIFDGVMLTEKGYALLNAAKETNYVVNAKEASNASTAKEDIVKVGGNKVLSTGMATVTADKNGVYTVKVEIANANKAADSAKKGQAWNPQASEYDVYYITGTSKAELTKVLGWIDGIEANVEEIAGEDRYATAVKVAKELAKLNDVAKDGNIVLVNGNSLVDGLAAAPLAEHLGAGVTPILLTENDKLPTATKKYLAELVDTAENKTVTVNIVGGNGVVSKAVEKELRSMNMKVERFGGEDREATSMAVAEEIGFDNGAFVVGATGEADAMSIAGYAADKVSPIVVSGFNGLSEDTLDELEGQRVTVIGGDSAVSAADYAAIKDVALTLGRVSGSDRKETNAEVIRRYYNGTFASAKNVIVAKDDVLIDALTSANLAAKGHAPIVLGTKELSKNQVEAIAKNASNATKVYQIGHGVERSVVKTVAQALGLI